PVAIDTEHPDVLAQVIEATQALPAGVVHDVRLRRHEGARLQLGDVRAGGHHMPGHLVAEDPWRMDVALRPIVPVEDVYVGSADRGGGDLDQDVAAGRLGVGNV